MTIRFTIILTLLFTISYSQTEFVSLGGIQDSSPTINNALLDAIQSIQNNGTITIKGDIIVRNDFIIPNNVILNFFKGHKLIFENGAKLTMNGGIQAGLYKIFEVENENSIGGNPIINYFYPQWFGAVTDDFLDDTNPLKNVLKLSKDTDIPIHLTTGIFNAKLTEIDSKIKITGNGTIRFKNTIIYREDLPSLGVPHNIEEKTFNKESSNPVFLTDGKINPAPLVKEIPNKGLDILAHWYNDFGLYSSASNPNLGYYGWYDWSWNFGNNGYDPKRHPLLGWYRGDDPVVLDWISYWLGNHGVNGVILTPVFSTQNWKEPTYRSHWVYQLMTNSKNFKSLKYVLSIEYDNNKTKAELKSQNDDLIKNVLSKYDNIYLYSKNGKKYVTLYCRELEMIRGVFDGYNGTSNTINYFIELSDKLKSRGFDGLCLLARDYKNVFFDNKLDYLESNDVILLSAGYEDRYGTDSFYNNQYSDYAKNVIFPKNPNQVINVVTSAESKIHPSGWKLKGSTPELFADVVKKAVNHIEKNKLPKILTIYNVSEWGEGGASLQPNQLDLFGYLNAIKSINKYSTNNISKSSLFNVTKEWYVSKRNDVTLNGGVGNELTIRSFGEDGQLDQFFNYKDNKEDYVFFVDIDFPKNNIDYQVSYYLNVNFNNKRVYINVFNKSGASISGVGISLMIRKIKI